MSATTATRYGLLVTAVCRNREPGITPVWTLAEVHAVSRGDGLRRIGVETLRDFGVGAESHAL